MKTNFSLIIKTFTALLFCQNAFAQFGINSITTNSTDLPTSNIIINRKGAGVQSMYAGLSNRWDSVGTNFNVIFNASNADKISITDIEVAGLGRASSLPFSPLVKVRRVANSIVGHNGDHFPFFAAVNAVPTSSENTGTFLVSAPEVLSMESALVSNNINTGYDNIFQNNNANVHYGNVERIDFIFPNGFIPDAGADLSKVGFTICDGGDDGNAFKIAGIKTINSVNNPTGYQPLTSITTANYGSKLLSTFKDFAIFQKDPTFNANESRPSVVVNQNMRGTFVSLAHLGFTDGQMIYGFSIFANDILATSTEAYLLDYEGYPTNTNSADMLDLVNSVGVYSINQVVVLSSSTLLTATLQHSKVSLQWNAASITGAQKVFLQRASDNMVYSNLTEITPNQQSYIDETAREDIAYYRLKIISVGGAVKYSNIQIIRSMLFGTNIFPTVTNSQLIIASNTFVPNKSIVISIYNMEGKLVHTQTKKPSSYINMDVSNLQNGMYIISISQNNNLVTREKFIKR